MKGYTELSDIPFASTDEALEEGLTLFSNIESRAPMTSEVYSESISALSNCISRKIDLYNTRDETDSATLKVYSSSYFETISETLRSYTEKV